MSLLKRSVRVESVIPPPLPGGVPTVSIRLPALQEFLTLQKWDDGSSRKPGSISLFWEDGCFKVWCNDKDASRSASVSAVTLEDLLLRLEGKLTEDSLEWRRSFGGGRSSKK